MTSENDHKDEEMEFEYKKVDHRSDRANDNVEVATSAGAETVACDDNANGVMGGSENGAVDDMNGTDAVTEELSIDIYQILRMMVGMISEQAWIDLGLHPRAGSAELEMKLPEARVSIDTLQFIRAQLEGNLQEMEKRELDNLISTLRMNYIKRA